MPHYSLSLLRHDQTSELLTFQKVTVLIGREGGDIVTGDPKMSNRHAELKFEGGVLRFTDLESTNGSYRVNGERVVGSILLTPGTALRLGDCTIAIQEVESGLERGGTQIFKQAAPAAPAPAVPAPAMPAPAMPAARAVDTSPPGFAGVPPNDAPPMGSAPIGAESGSEAPLAQPATSAPNDGRSVNDSLADMDAEMAQVIASGPTGNGVFDQFKYYLALGASAYKAHFINGALTMGLVAVPATLITAATSWIPILGVIVAILVGLVELALAPISAGAMGRWALSAASGQSLSWKDAWSAALKNPVSEWLNVVVAMVVTMIGTMLLIVPGIIVGMFALPAYLLEDKRFIAINMRSVDLVMKDPPRHLGLALLVILTALPVFILSGILTFILGMVPAVGGPLAQVVSIAVMMLVLPFIYLLWSFIYFDVRKRLEGEDAKQLHLGTILSWKSRT